MITGGKNQFANKKILLLQGPLGPFFNWLSHDLRKAGAEVSKVNFNGGDYLFFLRNSIAFRDNIQAWPLFLEKLLDSKKIDIIILFGDCRPLHRIACAIAYQRGIRIGVFEEGYIRPNFITFEQYGVNGYSQIPRMPDFYRGLVTKKNKIEQPVGNTFWQVALWSILYYAASTLLQGFFRRYQHHRPLTVLEIIPWIKSFWRKGYFALKERGTLRLLTTTLAGQYFFVPLQVHNDVQIGVHSTFSSVQNFILQVLISFARHAPKKTYLVIKHHPMDRGYNDYGAFIREQIQLLAISERVIYIHDQHLPTILQYTRGVVLINSTVGFSALHHGVPMKVCGTAIYDMEGLTFQGDLDSFWTAAQECIPDKKLFLNLRNYLIENTQLNGSFYKKLPDGKNFCNFVE
ncbi:Capsule polysaccharide export protein KpsS [Gammaproteobacteria bacterium]